MKIDKSLDHAVLTLKLEGMLDTTTAPMLGKIVETELAGVQELILDCAALVYVSSAGLRVILTAQDIMDEQGRMKVIHVNEMVMEIFDITGLVDLLTIE